MLLQRCHDIKVFAPNHDNRLSKRGELAAEARVFPLVIHYLP